MKKSDAIREQLEQARIPQWSEKRAKALAAGAPGHIAAKWLLYVGNWEKRVPRAEFRASALSDADRRALLETAFPRLATYLERAWQDLAHAPYTPLFAYGPTPFRAPHHNRLVAEQRDNWIDHTFTELRTIDPDPVWLATFGSHIGQYSTVTNASRALVAALDMGGPVSDEVLSVLTQAASGTHDIATMNQYVIDTLLACSREDAWTFIEKLLLAAQRQEGLRQSILESLPEAHPGAFLRFLRLIKEERLVRFASTVRAIDVWFGFAWDSMSTAKAESIIENVLDLIDDPAARAAALQGKDPESVYLALWCEAHSDAERALALAAILLDNKAPEKRWVGVHAIAKVSLPEGDPHLVRMLKDDDLRVAAHAMDGLNRLIFDPEDETQSPSPTEDKHSNSEVQFNAIESLLARIPEKEVRFKPLVFPWGRDSLTADEVGMELVRACRPAHVDRLISHLSRLKADTRYAAASEIAQCSLYSRFENRPNQPHTPLSPLARKALIEFLGDASPDVRRIAAERLELRAIQDDEAQRHEQLLSRTVGDIRTRAITRLSTLPDDRILEIARRLLSGNIALVNAALGLLRILVENNRSIPQAQSLAAAAKSKIKKPSKETRAALEAILTARPASTLSAADAFGLATPQPPRPIPKLRALPPYEPTPAAVACIWSLEDLVEANKTFELVLRDEQGQSTADKGHETLLGEFTWNPAFHPHNHTDTHRPNQYAVCPIANLLDEWLASRTPDMKDSDGLELLRAWILTDAAHSAFHYRPRDTWTNEVIALAPKGRNGTPRYIGGIHLFMEWALRRHTGSVYQFFLDQLEAAASRGDVLRQREDLPSGIKTTYRSVAFHEWEQMMGSCPAMWGKPKTLEDHRRIFNIDTAADDALLKARARRPESKATQSAGKSRRHQDEDEDNPRRITPPLDTILQLWHAGEYTDDELLIRLAMGRPSEYSWSSDEPLFYELSELVSQSARSGNKYGLDSLESKARLDSLVDALRRTALQIELDRGDPESVATPLIHDIKPSGGIEAVIPALAGLANQPLLRGFQYADTISRQKSFSAIIKNSRPTKADTHQAFAKAAKDAALSEQRLIELALYQPAWAPHVEHALKCPGLEEGALWLRAHTKERKEGFSHPDYDDTEPWEIRLAELSPIPTDRFNDGVVDRAWFERTYKKLGPKRWESLYTAAKYASSGTGHNRARLFADAMLAKLSEKELTTRITTKRNQDAARALGLLAIKSGEPGKKQVLARYKVLQELRRTSRKHGGSMLQASEKRAVEVGMENLAWTAGYPDPLRLQWAMEIEEFGDLAKGPVTLTIADTTITLAVDDDGVPSLAAEKKSKALKSIPPALKKDKKVAPLVERLTSLRRQSTRVRQALEQAMCRGDEFTGTELPTLFAHPLLKASFKRLVLIAKTKAGATMLGYPDKNAKVLRDLAGELEPLRATDSIRIAHPLDLLATKRWDRWQRECFQAERVQPFKQVFREVYVPTQTELGKPKDPSTSFVNRYAGQQVQPRQALALFGSRGWVARPEEGVQRTFHHERLTVRLEFEETFFTPAEIDGLTLAGLSFSNASTHESIPIKNIPARLFSEIMRDIDLVVSVAHRGEVDPEASHSTVEMRAALIRETCQLLGLTNVTINNNRAIITGTLAEYALHLGSGTIQLMPGGSIWVIPVHSQHRGRIFLPFADNDPKSAEIMSKLLLLARDAEIQDPQILRQIRG
ncbi:MAG: DUF5724 domain-containing protein [Phycisphaerales bacterium]